MTRLRSRPDVHVGAPTRPSAVESAARICQWLRPRLKSQQSRLPPAALLYAAVRLYWRPGVRRLYTCCVQKPTLCNRLRWFAILSCWHRQSTAAHVRRILQVRGKIVNGNISPPCATGCTVRRVSATSAVETRCQTCQTWCRRGTRRFTHRSRQRPHASKRFHTGSYGSLLGLLTPGTLCVRKQVVSCSSWLASCGVVSRDDWVDKTLIRRDPSPFTVLHSISPSIHRCQLLTTVAEVLHVRSGIWSADCAPGRAKPEKFR
jgi:hypothetical protein